MNIKIVSISVMLFYVHYLKLPQLLTGPDSKLNFTALCAPIDSSFWFQTGPLYISMGHRLLFPNKIAFLKNFLKIVFVLANSVDTDKMQRFYGISSGSSLSKYPFRKVTSMQRVKVCTEDFLITVITALYSSQSINL